MLQVHVVIHMQLLHLQLRLRVVVPWTMDVNPKIEVVYLGESDSPSNLKSPANSIREAVGARSITAEQRGSLNPEFCHELFG